MKGYFVLYLSVSVSSVRLLSEMEENGYEGY